MMRRWTTAAALAAFLCAIAAPAQATVSLVVNGSGQLTGATGVVVNGANYNVTFGDGTCAGLFGGCDSPGDFIFNSAADATAAAQALLDQVFIDGISGSFDTLPGKTNGCAGSESFCAALIPYSADPDILDHILASVANNGIVDANDSTLSGFSIGTDADTSANNFLTFAVFSPVSAVPETSTWVMMLLGFAGISLASPRRSYNERNFA